MLRNLVSSFSICWAHRSYEKKLGHLKPQYQYVLLQEDRATLLHSKGSEGAGKLGFCLSRNEAPIECQWESMGGEYRGGMPWV